MSLTSQVHEQLSWRDDVASFDIDDRDIITEGVMFWLAQKLLEDNPEAVELAVFERNKARGKR